MKSVRWCVGILFLAATFGCKQQSAVNLAEEEAAIRATDAQWQAAVKARDLEKTVSFWADDATVIPANAPPIIGKLAIRAYVAGAFASPDFSIAWNTGKVAISRSGDLAYSTATNTITYRQPRGGMGLVMQKANAVVVWKKQPEGSWKAVIDIWNAETPIPSAQVSGISIETAPLRNQSGQCRLKLVRSPALEPGGSLIQPGESYNHPVLRVNIEESGATTNVHLVKSSGIRRLDALLLRDVGEWKYAPRPGCGVIETNIGITIDWK